MAAGNIHSQTFNGTLTRNFPSQFLHFTQTRVARIRLNKPTGSVRQQGQIRFGLKSIFLTL